MKTARHAIFAVCFAMAGSYTTVIEFAEPLARRRGSAFGRYAKK
jgi:hypothetical protein